MPSTAEIVAVLGCSCLISAGLAIWLLGARQRLDDLLDQDREDDLR